MVRQFLLNSNLSEESFVNDEIPTIAPGATPELQESLAKVKRAAVCYRTFPNVLRELSAVAAVNFAVTEQIVNVLNSARAVNPRLNERFVTFHMKPPSHPESIPLLNLCPDARNLLEAICQTLEVRGKNSFNPVGLLFYFGSDAAAS